MDLEADIFCFLRSLGVGGPSNFRFEDMMMVRTRGSAQTLFVLSPMSVIARQLRVARPLVSQTRSFSSSLIVREAVVGTPAPAKRPIGGIRGG